MGGWGWGGSGGEWGLEQNLYQVLKTHKLCMGMLSVTTIGLPDPLIIHRVYQWNSIPNCPITNSIFSGRASDRRYSCEYAERIREMGHFLPGYESPTEDQYSFLAIFAKIRREDSIPASSQNQFYS